MNLTHNTSDTGKHLVSAVYNGVTLKIYIHGVEVESAAKTGTMSNECTAVTEGAATTGGNRVEGKIHETAMFAGPLSTDQRVAVDAYMMREAGIT